MKKIFIILSLILLSPTLASAELFDRGGGLIYDSDLNVTWLQDANYIDTSGYDDALYGLDTGGKMKWSDANEWVLNLSYYDSIRDIYWDDWRLSPTMQPDSSCTFQLSDGVSRGYNCTGSEMGYLFYAELDNVAYGYYDTNGQWVTGGCTPGVDCGLVNSFPFNNLQNNAYWSNTEYSQDSSQAWYFSFSSGGQGNFSKSPPGSTSGFYVIALRDGDVAATVVPEPISSLLFVTGGAFLAGRRYTRNKQYITNGCT